MASIEGLTTTIREGIRYRGNIGHWSWVAHRVSGLAILGFLTIHVWDTANATFRPDIYAWSIDVFKHPFFGIGEVAILGAVLYHAFNGLRITLLDFKPEWWRFNQKSAWVVWGAFLLLFVPMLAYLVGGIYTDCTEKAAVGQSCWVLPDINEYLGNPAYSHEALE